MWLLILAAKLKLRYLSDPQVTLLNTIVALSRLAQPDVNFGSEEISPIICSSRSSYKITRWRVKSFPSEISSVFEALKYSLTAKCAITPRFLALRALCSTRQTIILQQTRNFVILHVGLSASRPFRDDLWMNYIPPSSFKNSQLVSCSKNWRPQLNRFFTLYFYRLKKMCPEN